jgi:hypothetical protein
LIVRNPGMPPELLLRQANAYAYWLTGLSDNSQSVPLKVPT